MDQLLPIDLTQFTFREGATPLISTIPTWDGSESLTTFLGAPVGPRKSFAVIGVPEDIGVRANHGRAGAAAAWNAFLAQFATIAANRFTQDLPLRMVGTVKVDDLQRKASTADVATLRTLVDHLDERVAEACEVILAAGATPLVIGGGHNNAFPLLKASFRNAGDSKIDVVNFDAHADYRALEGRHSGNPFHYADAQGLLGSYTVIGLNPLANSEAMLADLDRRGWRVLHAQQARAEQLTTFVNEALARTAKLALEIDLDVITGCPSSARTVLGMDLFELCTLVESMVEKIESLHYLHLSEGAPPLAEDGDRIVGQTLCRLVVAAALGRARSG